MIILKRLGLFIILLNFYTTYGRSKIIISPENIYYIEQFGIIFDKVTKEYVQEPDKQKMLDGALNGMLNSLDPHSQYFTDDELHDFITRNEGKFGGIGVEIVYEDNVIKIVTPLDDLPAAKAGIQSGDYIIAVQGELVRNLGFHTAVKNMRGEPGTKVKITILKENATMPQEIELVREVVKTKAVKFSRDNGVGYVRLATFTENSINELKSAINVMNTEPGLEGIVLDLRNNPGGPLDQAIKVVEYFIPSGVIVSTEGREAGSNKTYLASSFAQKGPQINMVVLINSGSASASEIVAGALQDHKRAIVLGTKSFGKASVQTFLRLDQRSGMKLTTAKYYTPKGRCIQAEGIQPDILVEVAKVEYLKPDDDKKFFEKSYQNHLAATNEDGKQNQVLAKSLGEITKKQSLELYKRDYQYARAFDLIKGLKIMSQ